MDSEPTPANRADQTEMDAGQLEGSCALDGVGQQERRPRCGPRKPKKSVEAAAGAGVPQSPSG